MHQRFTIVPIVAALSIVISGEAWGQRAYVELRSGMRLGPGLFSTTETMSANAYAKAAAQEAGMKMIGVMDDDLRYTYFNFSKNNVPGQQVVARQPIVIEFPAYKAEIETNGGELSIQSVLGISDFNKFGRRSLSIQTAKGPKHLLQAITAISPLYCQVETLRVSDSIAWDQRIATSSLGPKLLREILMQQLDLSTPKGWSTLLQFYMEAERFTEAREILEEALRKFPNDFDPVLLGTFDELNAAKLFQEVKVRQNAGQYQLATEVLNTFKLDTLPLEVQLKVQDQFESLKQSLLMVAEIIEALKKDLQALPEAEQQAVRAVVEEILREVNLDSVNRLADYQRLRADETLSAEQRVALALGGWMLGSGSGLDNFATAKSLSRVRELVGQYLVEADEARRGQILTQLKSEEGGRPDLVVKVLAMMKPPRKPPAAMEGDPPGLHRMQCAVGGEIVEYLVQTPPEYDPNRNYPCIVSLPSLSTNPEYQLNWWCGVPLLLKKSAEDEGAVQRLGLATRYGYIVISPVWATKGQLQYNYSEVEHNRVLKCYRDALRHFSIDTDRAFITGHHAGASLAWDVALSHPDLWAGAVMVSPTAEKFLLHYEENAKLMPMYFVYGSREGLGFHEKIGATLDKYISSSRYDVMAVSYRGREAGYFPEEAPRIMEWMELSSHRRVRNPKEIKVAMMRPGDRFFYWIEAPDFTTDNHSLLFNPQDTRGLEASLNARNGVSVTQNPSPSTVIWLSPDIVDFSQPVSIRVKGSTKKVEPATDVGVVLEDARTRGDRLHPFHMRVSFP